MPILSLKESLTRGLRKDYRTSINSGQMIEIINMKSTEYGLAPVGNIVETITSSQLLHAETASSTASPVYKDWPFPQMFIGKSSNLLAAKEGIYTITDPLVKLTTYDATSYADAKSITAGGPWHFADMGDAWIFTNGECCVLRTNWHDVSGNDFPDKYYVSDIVINTCAYWEPGHGRVFTGGFSSSDTHPAFGTLDSNFVAWSTIGGGDVFWHFFEDEIDTHLDSVLEDRNEYGFMEMPWQGDVLCLKPLGDYMMVYGDNGIGALYNASGIIGYKHVLDFGIPKRSAVGGDLHEHVFVSHDGDLYRISSSLQWQKVGYREYIWQMLGTVNDTNGDNEIVVSLDPSERDYYICDEDYSFVLGSRGLSRCNKSVTALTYQQSTDTHDIRMTGKLIGVYSEVDV